MKQEATKTVPIYLLAVVIVLLTGAVAGSAGESIQASIIPAQSMSPIPVLDPEDAAAGQAVRWTKFIGRPESLKSIPVYTYRLDDVCGPLPRPEATAFKRWWATTFQKVGMVTLVAKTGELPIELTSSDPAIVKYMAEAWEETPEAFKNISMKLPDNPHVARYVASVWEGNSEKFMSMKMSEELPDDSVVTMKSQLEAFQAYPEQFIGMSVKLPEDPDVVKTMVKLWEDNPKIFEGISVELLDDPVAKENLLKSWKENPEVLEGVSVKISGSLVPDNWLEIWNETDASWLKYIGVNFGNSYKIGEKINPYMRDTLCDAVAGWADQYQGKIAGHIAKGLLEELEGYYIAVEYPFVDHDARDPFWAAKTTAKP